MTRGRTLSRGAIRVGIRFTLPYDLAPCAGRIDLLRRPTEAACSCGTRDQRHVSVYATTPSHELLRSRVRATERSTRRISPNSQILRIDVNRARDGQWRRSRSPATSTTRSRRVPRSGRARSRAASSGSTSPAEGRSSLTPRSACTGSTRCSAAISTCTTRTGSPASTLDGCEDDPSADVDAGKLLTRAGRLPLRRRRQPAGGQHPPRLARRHGDACRRHRRPRPARRRPRPGCARSSRRPSSSRPMERYSSANPADSGDPRVDLATGQITTLVRGD